MIHTDDARLVTEPERQCVACRRMAARSGLIRLVRLPDGTITLDPKQALHGRGAYSCRNATCLEQAVRKGGFARALRQRIPGEALRALDTLIEDILAPGTNN